MGEPRSFDIDLLRSFLLIAGGVSFTHAAERVGRTQAAVTLQIKRLEAMVGHRLLERGSRAWRPVDPKGGTPRRARERTRLAQRQHYCLSSTTKHPAPALPFEGQATSKPSIAVLPFEDMSDDAGQQYFVDGIVEDLISRLSRIRWLVVIACNSSAIYQGQVRRYPGVGEKIGCSLCPSG